MGEDAHDIILESCDLLESELAAIADAYTVLSDEGASAEARSLALRTLDKATQGYTHALDEIRERATDMHETAETLRKTDAA